MNTTFIISGGAGRVITAIPALEKFYRLNPNNDFKVLVPGWEFLYWGHPVLHSKAFHSELKGGFDLLIKNNILKHPEPYHLHSYYNQKTSLAEAFDEEINSTNDHSDIIKPNLYCSTSEILSAKSLIEEAKSQKNKTKFVVFQPYGSTMQVVGDHFYDASGRSLDTETALKLSKIIAEDAVVFYFGPNEFINPEDSVTFNASQLPNSDLRFFMSLISQCDYFVGVDSVGQHMARAFDKPGLVIMGSTFEKNVSYPKHFKFYRNGKEPTYSPIRINGNDSNMSDRINDGIMFFTDKQIHEMGTIVKKSLR